MDNAILKSENNVPARIAQRTLAKRGAGYASEVRRLLDAALEVMRQGGTASRPRVADIVAATPSLQLSCIAILTGSNAGCFRTFTKEAQRMQQVYAQAISCFKFEIES